MIAALLLVTLVFCSLLLSVVIGDNVKSLRSEASEAEGRELADYIGRQVPNNCASIFDGKMVDGQTCSKCNNPCARLDTTGSGCGVGSYCTCAYAASDRWQAKPPIAKCVWCPYMKAGTTCPGDGFWYDKSYPAPVPIVRAPTAPPVKMAPACGSVFGTCTFGQYCRQKSTDWTFVCTACPSGLVCPGDGTRKTVPSPCGAMGAMHGDFSRASSDETPFLRRLASKGAAAIIGKVLGAFCPLPAPVAKAPTKNPTRRSGDRE